MTPRLRELRGAPSASGDQPDGAAKVRMAGCTSVSGNYLAFARVLAAAWGQRHPDAPFYVLVIDVNEAEFLEEEFTVVTPIDLGLDVAEVHVRAGIYDAFELATSLKPLLLRYVLEHGAEAAVYIDPDGDLFDGITDIGLAASEHEVALIPHFLRPVPLDGCSPTEIEQLSYGVYNSGLIAVGASAGPFLSWWAARVSRDCLMDHRKGFHADQPWLDFVAVYFRCVVIDDPTIQVAWWNLHERKLDTTSDGYLVNGLPLRHFHFSGFDPARPSVLSLNLPPRLRAGIRESPVVARLLEEYAAKVIAAGHRDTSQRPYVYGVTAAGKTLGRPKRRAYRAAVIEAEANGALLPPDPFERTQSREFGGLIRRARTASAISGVVDRVRALRRVVPAPLRRAAKRTRPSGGRS